MKLYYVILYHDRDCRPEASEDLKLLQASCRLVSKSRDAGSSLVSVQAYKPCAPVLQTGGILQESNISASLSLPLHFFCKDRLISPKPPSLIMQASLLSLSRSKREQSGRRTMRLAVRRLGKLHAERPQDLLA